MTEFSVGQKVWVKYGSVSGTAPKAYKGKLVGQDRDGDWLVRECWTFTVRVIPERSLAHVQR